MVMKCILSSVKVLDVDFEIGEQRLSWIPYSISLRYFFFDF